VSEHIRCEICCAESNAGVATLALVCHQCWVDQQAKVEQMEAELKTECQLWSVECDELQAEIERLQAERDDARKAARWLYEAWSRDEDEPVPPQTYEGPVEVRWPWVWGEVNGE